MVKLSQKSRKIPGRVFWGLVVIAVFLLLQACGGTPSAASPSGAAHSIAAPSDDAHPGAALSVALPSTVPGDIFIHGSVRSRNTGTPIHGIKVSLDEGDYEELTTNSGRFYIYPHSRDAYTLIFEDIDGTENGGLFKRYTQRITLDEAGSPLIIYLDEDK